MQQAAIQLKEIEVLIGGSRINIYTKRVPILDKKSPSKFVLRRRSPYYSSRGSLISLAI
ncbi:hypothetical protein P4829_10060 [Bacillus atrophaeus]|uniref:hypothetical protein n=1 Tax=Bacillus atrophaeus TaxID=1452 RepID=UPI00240D413C|nr:hypothetical protein [Bacillus atrophaeus]WFE15963.1 hypothetical protein P4829_10060 [Bacillus atrophaeus]